MPTIVSRYPTWNTGDMKSISNPGSRRMTKEKGSQIRDTEVASFLERSWELKPEKLLKETLKELIYSGNNYECFCYTCNLEYMFYSSQ